jgi:hypothetical protein
MSKDDEPGRARAAAPAVIETFTRLWELLSREEQLGSRRRVVAAVRLLLCIDDHELATALDGLAEQWGRKRPAGDPSGDRAVIDDVIQLAPEWKWGPVLCIVTASHDWGVECYAFANSPDHARWGQAPLRIEHGTYAIIGEAKWVSR